MSNHDKRPQFQQEIVAWLAGYRRCLGLPGTGPTRVNRIKVPLTKNIQIERFT